MMTVITDLSDLRRELSTAGMAAVVNGKDKNGAIWQEAAEVTNYSATGACIRLSHKCGAGCLISLMLPIPPHLRCYDHDAELYEVWGLVQHSQKATTETDEKYYVGVAFIGKNAPVDYHDDPGRSYRICGMSSQGLWKVEGLPREFKSRREIRYWTPIELYLAHVDPDRKMLSGAKATTENVSKGGAAVISDLDVNVGERVKFISEEFDFSGLAVVCGRQTSTDLRSRIHLKFIEDTFPVEKLTQTNAQV